MAQSSAPFGAGGPETPGGGYASGPPPYHRHPLGLPAGSVRALLAFMVLGLIWTILLLPEKKEHVHVPAYLYYLMFLILGHYFAARGPSGPAAGVREAPPLFLPRGTIRFLIVLGFAAVLGWGFYHNPDFLDRLQPGPLEQPYLPLVLVCAFFLGIVVSRMSKRLLAGPEGLPGWYQDIQAWVSLLAVLGLTAEILIRLVIYPSVEQKLDLQTWEAVLGAIVGFYFGARS